MKNKILKCIVYLFVLYLFISAIYVFFHIDFGKINMSFGQGFSESKNQLRIFMGLPKTLTTYEGVPPVYLIQVIIKMFLGIILLIFVNKKSKKDIKN